MKFHIITLGCKLNFFESSAMLESLIKCGFEFEENPDQSDLIIVNSCTVTNKSDNKSLSIIRKYKEKNKLVVLTGCLAETNYQELVNKKIADIIIKNSEKFSIAEILSDKILCNHISIKEKTEFPLVVRFERTRAYIKIQDGCNKYCSYCKIPYARGHNRSEDLNKIIDNFNYLLSKDFKEIIITGVNISAYNYNNKTLADLIEALLLQKGDFRIRLSSLQPDEFEPELIDLLESNKLCNHFHLSLQSGSNETLKRMHRRYTKEYYLDLIEKIRNKDFTCGITTDIIVGFPGETEEEFKDTIETVRKANFTRCHIFPFSLRKNTIAERLPNHIDENTKKGRVKILEKEYMRSNLDYANKYLLNTKSKILIEEYEIKTNLSTGYSSNYIKTYITGELEKNKFYTVIFKEFFENKGTLEAFAELKN